MKKIISLLLCVAVLLSFTAFAEETLLPEEEPKDATVTLTTNKASVVTGETGLELTVNITATTKNITTATVVIAIDSDAITVADTEPVAETTYNYEVEITNEVPATTASKVVPLDITGLDVTPGDTTISIASATIMDDAETPAEMTSDTASTVTIAVANPVINAKLNFAHGIKTKDNITVTYEEVIPVSEPETPAEGGEGTDPQTEGEETPTPKVYTTTLTLRADGKTVVVEPVLAEEETEMAAGTYKVVIAADGYKAEAVENIIIDAEHPVPVWDADMTAGYITEDDAIDLYDFHELCKAIGTEEPAVKYDLNRDGNVDKKDAALLITNWILPAEEGEEE